MALNEQEIKDELDNLNPPPYKKLKLMNHNDDESEDSDIFFNDIEPDLESDDGDDNNNNNTNKQVSFQMYILDQIQPAKPLKDQYHVQVKNGTFNEFIINYDNSDTFRLKSSGLQTTLKQALNSGKRVSINHSLQSDLAKHAKSKQERTLSLMINSSSDIVITLIDNTIPLNINPWTLFDIHHELNIWNNQQYFDIIGYLLAWEKRHNYCVAVVHILNKQYDIKQGALLAMVKYSKDPNELIPVGSLFVALNVNRKFFSSYGVDEIRLYITWSKIIILSETVAFRESSILPPNKLQTIKYTGLTNATNNVNRPEWNERTILNNLRFDKQSLDTLPIDKVFRIKDVLFPDCSKGGIKLNCGTHRTPLGEASHLSHFCVIFGSHPVSNEDKEYNFQYSANVSVQDVDGNIQIMKPNWKFMEEATGHSINKLSKKWKQHYSDLPFPDKFRKSIFQRKLKKKRFTIDFIIRDDWKNRNDFSARRFFIIQVHRNNIIQPISFDRCFCKVNRSWN